MNLKRKIFIFTCSKNKTVLNLDRLIHIQLEENEINFTFENQCFQQPCETVEQAREIFEKIIEFWSK